MKTAAPPLLLCLSTFLSRAMGTPFQHNPWYIRVRNATKVGNDVLSDYFWFKPAIVNPKCGGYSPSTVSVQFANDPAFLAEGTQDLLQLIGGTKGKQDADVTFICPGVQVEGTGSNENTMKLVFYLADSEEMEKAKGRDRNIIADLQVIYLPDDAVVNTRCSLAAESSGKDGFAIGRFMC